MPITFAVSPVDVERAPMPRVPLDAALASRGVDRLEAAASSGRALVEAPGAHALLAAVHLAYAEHRPLALTPDHVWLCIAQALARHIEANAETLRRRFVAHEGRRVLEVRRDDFVPGQPGNDWPGAIGTFSDALREILGAETHGFFVAEASTTDAIARTASEIVLMGAMQQYFSFHVATLCGIPSITLEGTRDDWSALLRRVDRLEGLGLDRWLVVLRRALTHFARAASGHVDESVWRQLYKAEDASGGTRTTGWINALFPFLGDRGAGPEQLNARAFEPEWKHALEGNTLDRFPPGLTQAPFTWRLLTTERPMSLVAGFVGVSQDGAGVLRPELGWAVTPRVLERRFDVHQFGALPSLTPRAPADADVLRSLGEESSALEAFDLSLSWQNQIASLEGLEGLHNLHGLTMLSCDRIESIEPLRGLRGLRRLQLQQCPALRDVRAVASLPSLDELYVAHCPNVTDLRPVAECRGLRVLGLYGDHLPYGIAGKHEGPAIARVQAWLRR
jgi:hypothetical protein